MRSAAVASILSLVFAFGPAAGAEKPRLLIYLPREADVKAGPVRLGDICIV